MIESRSFVFPGIRSRVVFGSGTLAQVASEMERLGRRKALVLTWRKPDGALIGRNRMNLCLNDYDEARLRPDAATNSAYTWGCGGNPFTRGQRWGIDRGWARSITPYGSIPGRLITTDTVLLDISLRRDLARALGMTVAQSTVRFHARVKHTDDDEGDADEA